MLSKDKFAVVGEEKEKGILGNNEKRNKIGKKRKYFEHFLQIQHIQYCAKIYDIIFYYKL